MRIISNSHTILKGRGYAYFLVKETESPIVEIFNPWCLG